MATDNISEKLDNFFGQFKQVRYKKKDTIIYAEDDPAGIFYVTKGFVRFYSITEEGKELTLNIFKSGSYFPAMWLISNIDNIYFYEAMTSVEVRRAPKDKVLKFLQENNDIMLELTKRILSGMNGLLIRIQYLLLADARQKVISVLTMLAARFGTNYENGDVFVELPVTHQDIANLAGLTRETTSLEMEKLKDEDLISYNKRSLVIKKSDKLQEQSLIYIDEKPLPYTF